MPDSMSPSSNAFCRTSSTVPWRHKTVRRSRLTAMFKLEPKIVNVPVGPWNAVVGVVVQAVVPLPSRDYHRVLQSRHKRTLFFRIGGSVTSKGLRLIFSCERV